MSFWPEIQEKTKAIQTRLKMMKYSCFLELNLAGNAGNLAGLLQAVWVRAGYYHQKNVINQVKTTSIAAALV